MPPVKMWWQQGYQEVGMLCSVSCDERIWNEMDAGLPRGRVVAVCCNPEAGLPKPVVEAVHLIEDWGVEGDYHAGRLVRHRYLAKKDPTRPNLRQALVVDAAVVEVIERRNPCYQLNGIDPRLLKAVAQKQHGETIFKAGMMTRILRGGLVRAGDVVMVLAAGAFPSTVEVQHIAPKLETG
jgi:hypothetical protein